MFCYQCGCELNDSDRCPNCNADVRVYKKIIYTSNSLYNQGLEKARVHDISGAVKCLEESLWYNKDNLDARNLLGLCYYEIGENVAALSQWIIGKGINDERLHLQTNPGEEYLQKIQDNRSQVEAINNAASRFNKALECCRNDNLDVARLHLKKVISVMPNFLKARQLLALLYMEAGEWKNAYRELRRCLYLDVNNTRTLRYLQETDLILHPEQSDKKNRAGRKDHSKKSISIKTAGTDTVTYRQENETIIQPANAINPALERFSGIGGNILTLIVGLILGAAVVAFLVMPARISSIRSSSADEVRTVSEQSAAKDTQIAELQSQIDTLTQENEEAQQTISDYESASAQESDTDLLLDAATAYLNDQNSIDTLDAFAKIDPETALASDSEPFTTLYNTLLDAMRESLITRYANLGVEAYKAVDPDYESAIFNLIRAIAWQGENKTQGYPEMLYYLADSYYQLYSTGTDAQRADEYKDYLTNARTRLQEIISDYPDSDYAQSAEQLLMQIADSIDNTSDSGNSASSDATSADTSSSDASSAGSSAGSQESSDTSSAASSSASSSSSSQEE